MDCKGRGDPKIVCAMFQISSSNRLEDSKNGGRSKFEDGSKKFEELVFGLKNRFYVFRHISFFTYSLVLKERGGWIVKEGGTPKSFALCFKFIAPTV